MEIYMKDIEQMPDTYYIFGAMIMAVNKMDTLLERDLKEIGVTSRQWLLTMIIESFFDNPPTLKEVARVMDSSHQNIKQVALKLQEKGLLKLEKDRKDARVTRLRMTEESYSFWEKIQPKSIEFMKNAFKDINSKELATARKVITNMTFNLIKMGMKDEEGMVEE
jgi:DNA-binding MarR family transcriptional regulator